MILICLHGPFGPGQGSGSLASAVDAGGTTSSLNTLANAVPRGLSRLHQLRDLLIGLLVILSQDVAVTDGLKVDADVVRGDDSQGTLDARVQRPPEPIADLTAQCDQAAPEGAARLDPTNLQGLAGGTGSALQRVVLPDLGIEHF